MARVAGTLHQSRAVRPDIGQALSMRDILPAEVRCHEATVDVGLGALHELERLFIERAVPSRQSEFATVRGCARLGLQDLGVDVGSPILAGTHGAPVWPPGIVGSMTHCTGYRAAAVGRADPILSIGIDAEPNAPLPDGLIDFVAGPDERRDLAELTDLDPHVAWDRVLFSAKESIYKAWFPLTGRWLGYEGAIVRIDPATTTYEGAIRDAGPIIAGRPLDRIQGRFAVDEALVVTSAVVTEDGLLHSGGGKDFEWRSVREVTSGLRRRRRGQVQD
jgi:4'-phosphopantetheinyl transferase EntD